MIPAKKAQELQKAGIPQSEHLNNACIRANDAICDMSRRGNSFVRLSVYFLAEKTFDEFVSYLKEYGYECTECKWAERTSSVCVRWSPDEAQAK